MDSMMLKRLLAVSSFVLLLASDPLHASILVPGSSFDVTLGTYDYTASAYTNLVTTSVPANGRNVFSYGSAVVTVSESEATLATGQQQVTISLLSTSDLFTETSADYLGGFLGVGIYGNALQFSSPFDLGSAILTFSGTGKTFSGDSVSLVANPNPFDGVFTGPRLVGGFQGVANNGFDSIELQLTTPLAATPEPSSVVLLATGLLGVGGAVKRRFSAGRGRA